MPPLYERSMRFVRAVLKRSPGELLCGRLRHPACVKRLRAVPRLVLLGLRDARAQRRWFLTTEEVPRTPLRVTPEGAGRLAEEWVARVAGDETCTLVGVLRPDDGAAVGVVEVSDLNTDARLVLGTFQLEGKTIESVLRRVPRRRQHQATVIIEARPAGDNWQAVVRGTAPENVDHRGRFVGPKTTIISPIGNGRRGG